MKKALLIFPLLIAQLLFAEDAPILKDQFNFKPTRSLQSLEFEGQKGSLKITGHNKEDIIISIKREKWSKKCDQVVLQTGPSLTVKFKASEFFSTEECSVNVTMMVPKKVDLKIAHGTMKTYLENLEGDLNYKTASGDLSGKGKFAIVDVKAASGDIYLEGLTGNATFAIASSDIKLMYDVCPKKGAKLDVTRASGDVEVFLPKDCKLKTTNKSATGDFFNEFGDTEVFDLRVNSVSASGDFRIKKLK